MSFAWTPEFENKARALYVDQLRPATTVARYVRNGCTGPDVVALAALRGWVRGLKYRYPAGALLATVRRLYIDQRLAPATIAEQLGAPFTAEQVRRIVSRRGWAKMRPPDLAREQRAAAGIATTRRRFRPAAPVRISPLGEGRAVPADVRAAIDAAVAAGKVTVLPTMYARGLSDAERQFWAAGAGGSWKDQAARSRRA